MIDRFATQIRRKWRNGRNVFVFHHEGSDLFELEEVDEETDRRAAFKRSDSRVQTTRVQQLEPPPIPKSAIRKKPKEPNWDQASLSGIRRTIHGMKSE